MLLTGGSSKAIAVSRQTDRGVTNSDQPIALVPVANGSAVAGTPVDVRCWSGNGGGLVAESVEALQYLDEKGTQVRIGNTLHTRMEVGSGTLYWSQVDVTQASVGTISYNTGYGANPSEPTYPAQIGYTLANGVATLSGMAFRMTGNFSQPGNTEFWVTGVLPEEIRRVSRGILGPVATYSSGSVQAELIYDRAAHRLAVRFRSSSSTTVTAGTWWVSLDGVSWRVGV